MDLDLAKISRQALTEIKRCNVLELLVSKRAAYDLMEAQTENSKKSRYITSFGKF